VPSRPSTVASRGLIVSRTWKLNSHDRVKHTRDLGYWRNSTACDFALSYLADSPIIIHRGVRGINRMFFTIGKHVASAARKSLGKIFFCRFVARQCESSLSQCTWGHVRAIESPCGFSSSRFLARRRDAARGRRIDRRDWCNLACARVESVLRSSGRLTRHRGLAPRHDGDFGPVVP